jgi:hypothetical protein
MHEAHSAFSDLASFQGADGEVMVSLVNGLAALEAWNILYFETKGCCFRLPSSPKWVCLRALSPVGTFMYRQSTAVENTFGSAHTVVENRNILDGATGGLPSLFYNADDSIGSGDKLWLTYCGQNICTLTIEKYTPNKAVECMKCYGTSKY